MASAPAIVLNSFSERLTLETKPVPVPGPGEITIRVLALYPLPFTKNILDGTIQYPLAFPLTPGGSCVGRVHTTGPDTTVFTTGQLVICDPTIHARDDPNTQILMGIHEGMSPGSKKLMGGPWRDGCFAQYVKMPLENVFALSEEVLLKQYGYDIYDLPLIQTCMIPFGGLEDAGVKSGDTVIVAPATGNYGGAAVLTALAMGATVIALGRSEGKLECLAKSFSTPALKTLRIDHEAGKDSKALQELVGPKGADVYIDFSPAAAAVDGRTPYHIPLCLAALRRGGTCSLMGGVFGEISISYGLCLINNLTIKGKFMYDRHQVEQVIKMVENGNLKLGKAVGQEVVGPFGLDKMQEAVEAAARIPGWGKSVLVAP